MRELTADTKQILLCPFEVAEVRIRTQPYVASYVTARVVMCRLDEVIPWQWSFKLAGAGVLDPNGVMHQDGCIAIHEPGGALLEYHDRGSAPPDLSVPASGGGKPTLKGQSKQAKHAVSDCFKRCAVHLGPGRYLYELQGVQGGSIPRASLEKALAAVGYKGHWDERHWGSIGGIREGDLEDEWSDGPPPGVPSPAQATALRCSEEDRSRILACVEAQGGDPRAERFLGWLAQHTRNRAGTLDDVLDCDVPRIIRALEEIGARRRAA